MQNTISIFFQKHLKIIFLLNIFTGVINVLSFTVGICEYINVGILKNIENYPFGNADIGYSYTNSDVYYETALNMAEIHFVILVFFFSSIAFKNRQFQIISFLITISLYFFSFLPHSYARDC